MSDKSREDADRSKAAELLKSHRVISMDVGLDRAIAAALAAERAAAVTDLRARVLALAELMDRDPWHKLRREDIAARIRAAVTDTTGAEEAS